MIAAMMAEVGPKRKKAIRIGISEKSIWRYGMSGKGISAFANVIRAANVAKTAAPARETVTLGAVRFSFMLAVANFASTYNRVSTHFWDCINEWFASPCDCYLGFVISGIGTHL
jgi:hypothetical protein